MTMYLSFVKKILHAGSDCLGLDHANRSFRRRDLRDNADSLSFITELGYAV